MYDRRPASRAACGTPTVAAGLTPVVCGSFHSAISSPLSRAMGPYLLSSEYIVDARGPFKRNRTLRDRGVRTVNGAIKLHRAVPLSPRPHPKAFRRGRSQGAQAQLVYSSPPDV